MRACLAGAVTVTQRAGGATEAKWSWAWKWLGFYLVSDGEGWKGVKVEG